MPKKTKAVKCDWQFQIKCCGRELKGEHTAYPVCNIHQV